MALALRKIKWHLFNILPSSLQGSVYKLLTSRMGYSRKFRKSRVGQTSYVDSSIQIIGWRNVFIGCNTVVSEGSWLNVNFRDNSTKRIVIGNNCHVGRQNFFSAGSLIEIKDYGFTGLNCHFLGCGHNIDSPLTPYLASGLSTGGIIEVGVNCWLATGVTVLQNVKIGCGTIVGARSLVVYDLPPFSIAIGNPCRVIKRFDFKNNRWVKIENWTDALEASMPSEEEYLSLLVKSNNKIPPSLLAGSSRFGWL